MYPLFQSGIDGKVLFAEPHSFEREYRCRWWDWQGTASPVEVQSAASQPYADMLVSSIKGKISFGGNWVIDDNPFASNPLRLGKFGTFKLFVNGATVATTSTGLVADWRITDQVDGMAEYTCSIVAAWKFTDFSGAFIHG